ncbi:hypothetical protein G7Y89_g10254 [Cudoniella acicularis]|uniref:Uncharacterized protein n=1 Tax=Cudoniella acicularis TaxID=354080 RepID=A0A8H4RD42_9HELO|nr:hypothetical protein G7Y89_g10254 [Cudoniella acicularis]
MRVQTATTTATTSMAFPSLPASPTLTNPDMILPYGEYDSTPSPPLGPYRPSVPGDEWVDPIKDDDMQFSLGPSHIGPATPTTPIIYGNGTMLSDIGEVTEAESTSGRKLPGPAERRMLRQTQNHNNSPIRSSPTIGHEILMKRTKMGTHQRQISVESNSTITSEGQSAELFKDFDDGVSVDDSNFQGDDEESVADSYSERVIAQETHRLSMAESILSVDDDQNSSAALSRRAEQILQNAKQRLNNMEGNLTRARSSLFVTPSGSLSSIHSSSPLSRSTPSPPQNGRIISPLGTIPSRHRQLHTPLDSPAGSPGHSRVYSENSIIPPVRGERFPVRASSAAGSYIGRNGLNSQTPEGKQEDSKRPGFSSPLSRTSPPHANALQPVNEDDIVPEFEIDEASLRARLDEGYFSPGGEHKGLTRSASTNQMRDLRDQMQDLKGRLSVLRDRARDDTMKRRSLQSLRTPSPFTAAEQWYTAAKSYGEEPLSADAGVVQPPWKQEADVTEDVDVEPKQDADDQEVTRHIPNYASSDVTSVYEDVPEGRPVSAIPPRIYEPRIEEEDEPPSPQKEAEEAAEEDDYNDEIVNADEADDYESDSSLYHDSLDHPISHEDREDAFDYEHFFLHSAMGTIGQQRRDSVSSFGSEDSTETTRGPIIEVADNADGRLSLTHIRSESSASISTIATFATAEEEPSSEEEENESERDGENFAVQEVDAPLPRASTPVTAKRATFGGMPLNVGLENDEQASTEEQERPSSAIRIRDQSERNGSAGHRPSVASFDSTGSTGSTRSFPLVNKPKSQESNGQTGSRESKGSIRSDSTTLIDRQSTIDEERKQTSPVHMLVKDDQILVERLVASLGKCVLGLQESGRGSYDGRVWRRRLDAARRVLEGEEGAV